MARSIEGRCVAVDVLRAADVERVADLAAVQLEAGEAVILPTDTVYGVAALASRPEAVERLFELKGRDASKPFAVLVGDEHQALALSDLGRCPTDVAEAISDLTRRWWPGPLTLVLPRRVTSPVLELGGDPSKIGVRCAQSPVVHAITRRVGPIATTSANRSGAPTPVAARAAASALDEDVALVIDAGTCDAPPSTVLDVTTRPFRVLRRGSIGEMELGLDASWLIVGSDERGTGG